MGAQATEKEADEVLTAKEKSLLSALEPRAASEGVEIVTLEIVLSLIHI